MVADARETAETDQSDEKPLLQRVASLLARQPRRVFHNLDITAQELGVSRRHLQRLTHAIAEGCCLSQTELLKSIISYLKLMIRASQLTVRRVIQRVSHDETPMRVRGSYGPEGPVHDHRARVFAIQEDWSFLIEYRASINNTLTESTIKLSGVAWCTLSINQPNAVRNG